MARFKSVTCDSSFFSVSRLLFSSTDLIFGYRFAQATLVRSCTAVPPGRDAARRRDARGRPEAPASRRRTSICRRSTAKRPSRCRARATTRATPLRPRPLRSVLCGIRAINEALSFWAGPLFVDPVPFECESLIIQCIFFLHGIRATSEALSCEAGPLLVDPVQFECESSITWCIF